MTAREDAIEAIARALHSDNCPDDVDWSEPCGCSDWDREAEVAYEAAEPIIRADEREHLRTSVANMWGRSSEWDDAIEAVLHQMDTLLGGESE